MLKRIILIAIMSISGIISISAQDIYVVLQFGNSLTNWASGHNDFSAMQDIERLCSTKPAIRIDDSIMSAMAVKYNVPRSQSYTLDDYIRCIQHEVDAGVYGISLREAINEVLRSSSTIDPTWENVLNLAQRKTLNYTDQKQRSQYEIQNATAKLSPRAQKILNEMCGESSSSGSVSTRVLSTMLQKM